MKKKFLGKVLIFLKKLKVEDKGMRSDSSGRIYIDNNVFFDRADVKKEIDKLKKYNEELVK